jgi:plasmid stabilization system protein ParE
MAELTWTAEAERWLRDIYDFIAQDNPATAIRTIEPLYRKLKSSGNSPNQATGTATTGTCCKRRGQPGHSLVLAHPVHRNDRMVMLRTALGCLIGGAKFTGPKEPIVNGTIHQ